MLALSFVPEPFVEASFEFVIEEICELKDAPELGKSTTTKIEEVASYF